MQLRRRDVVDKALHLLDEYGIADLTMRRLARELGVSPGALYWHFADKQELLGAVADRILQPVADCDAGASWHDRIHVICRALRDALLSTTDGAELVSATFAAGKSERMIDLLGKLGTAAVSAGFAAAQADLAARTVLYYVLGFTADEQSRLQWDAVGGLSAQQSVLSSNPNGRFAFGLQLWVDGMDSMVAQRVMTSEDADGAGGAIPLG